MSEAASTGARHDLASLKRGDTALKIELLDPDLRTAQM